MSTPYLVSRLSFLGSPEPLAVCDSREAANKMIAELEAKDPKGSLVFYTRVPMKERGESSRGFRVSRVASAIAAFCD